MPLQIPDDENSWDNLSTDLLEIFSTEFHLRFLWGSKGATVESAERYRKFEQLLTLMAERCSGEFSEIGAG